MVLTLVVRAAVHVPHMFEAGLASNAGRTRRVGSLSFALGRSEYAKGGH